MRRFLLAFGLLISTVLGIAQCPAPEIASWHFSTSSDVDVQFYATSSVEQFQFIIYTNYDGNPSNGQSFERDTITGNANPGLNTISYNTVELLSEAGIYPGAGGSPLYFT